MYKDMYDKHITHALFHVLRAEYWLEQHMRSHTNPSRLFVKEHIDLAKYQIASAKKERCHEQKR